MSDGIWTRTPLNLNNINFIGTANPALGGNVAIGHDNPSSLLDIRTIQTDAAAKSLFSSSLTFTPTAANATDLWAQNHILDSTQRRMGIELLPPIMLQELGQAEIYRPQ